MSNATISSKGQITLPKDVRTRLHLEAGEKIAFQVDEVAGTALLSPMNKTVDEVFGILQTPGRKKAKTVEEMDKAVREKFKKENA